MENYVDRKVKCLRTYNGLELCNHYLMSFSGKNGIARHRTCTYTPHQNGVAERMNMTIMKDAMCLLNEPGLGDQFWAEAATTSTYAINRSLVATIGFKTPEQVWLGKHLGYKHMRKFGSVVYVHIYQDMLQPRAVKGVFIGYPT